MFIGVVGLAYPQPRRPSFIHDPTFWFVLLLEVDRARKGHELPGVRLTNEPLMGRLAIYTGLSHIQKVHCMPDYPTEDGVPNVDVH